MDNNYPVYPYLAYTTQVKIQPIAFPPQNQEQQPGLEWLMTPPPIFDYTGYIGSGKLKGMTALITDGDSGIGRAIAVAPKKALIWPLDT